MLKYSIIIFFFVVSIPVFADFKSGGDAYKRGDYETAANVFKHIAEKGDHRAMSALGSMYSEGHGVPQDFQLALKWFRKAAQYGRPDAQYKIGFMYEKGLGINQDYRRAINWYGKAAKKGYEKAQYRIGLMYAEGHGVNQSNVKAYAWLHNAFSQGVTEAKENLVETAKKLTPEELEEAQALAQTYSNKYRKR